MKPCRKNKMRIALLSVDGLEAQEARQMHEHLQACPGCQNYWKELKDVCRDQQDAAESWPAIEAQPEFHRRLQRRLANPSTTSTLVSLPHPWRRQIWKLAIPVAAMVSLSLVLLRPARPRIVNEEPGGTPPILTAAPTETQTPPRLSSYRLALHRSFEALDELLDKQGAHGAGSPEPVTLAALSRIPRDWP